MSYHVVKIRADTWNRLRDLQRVHDLDVFRQTAKQLADGLFEIEGLLSDDQIGELSKKGYQIVAIADAEEIARKRAKEVSRSPSPPKNRSED